MRYADVNQLVFSKASRSAAMVDCVVVRREIFVADKRYYFRSLGLKTFNRITYLAGRSMILEQQHI